MCDQGVSVKQSLVLNKPQGMKEENAFCTSTDVNNSTVTRKEMHKADHKAKQVCIITLCSCNSKRRIRTDFQQMIAAFFSCCPCFLKENAKILQDLLESILMDPRLLSLSSPGSCQEHASGCLYLCDEECLCYKDVQWTGCKEENVCAQEQTWMIARSPRQKCTEQTFTKRELVVDVQICITLCKLQFEERNSKECSTNASILFLRSIFSDRKRKSFKTFLDHS